MGNSKIKPSERLSYYYNPQHKPETGQRNAQLLITQTEIEKKDQTKQYHKEGIKKVITRQMKRK